MQIKVFLVCAIYPLDTVYSKQSLKIEIGYIKIGLQHSVAKRALDFIEITGGESFQNVLQRKKLLSTPYLLTSVILNAANMIYFSVWKCSVVLFTQTVCRNWQLVCSLKYQVGLFVVQMKVLVEKGISDVIRP